MLSFKFLYPGKGIPYTLSQSSHYGGGQDSYESLVDDNFTMTGATTTSQQNAFIQATFDQPQKVNYVYISHVAGFPGGFGAYYTNGLEFQYSQDGSTWTTLFTVSGLQDINMLQKYSVNQTAKYYRLFRVNGYAACGTFIFV